MKVTSGTKYTKFIYILYVRTHYEIKDDFLFFEDLALPCLRKGNARSNIILVRATYVWYLDTSTYIFFEYKPFNLDKYSYLKAGLREVFKK